jgi:hypothetical protein
LRRPQRQERSDEAFFAAILDDFVSRSPTPPTHIKIDVDGIESLVIKGAAETLRAPVLRSICIEMDTSVEANAQARREIEAAGFRLTPLFNNATCRNEIFERV